MWIAGDRVSGGDVGKIYRIKASVVAVNLTETYDWNGMASVVGMVKDGSMTAQEACDTIIIPAHQAGFVEERRVEAFLKRYPEMKPYLITHSFPLQNPPLLYPNTL